MKDVPAAAALDSVHKQGVSSGVTNREIGTHAQQRCQSASPVLSTTLVLPRTASQKLIPLGWGRLSWFDSHERRDSGATLTGSFSASDCRDSNEKCNSPPVSKPNDSGSKTRKFGLSSLHRSLLKKTWSQPSVSTSLRSPSNGDAKKYPETQLARTTSKDNTSKLRSDLDSEHESGQVTSGPSPPPAPVPRNSTNFGFILERPSNSSKNPFFGGLKSKSEESSAILSSKLSEKRVNDFESTVAVEGTATEEESELKTVVNATSDFTSDTSYISLENIKFNKATKKVDIYPVIADTAETDAKQPVLLRAKPSSVEKSEKKLRNSALTIPPRPPANLSFKRHHFKKLDKKKGIITFEQHLSFQQSECLVSSSTSSSCSDLSISTSTYNPAPEKCDPIISRHEVKTNQLNESSDGVTAGKLFRISKSSQRPANVVSSVSASNCVTQPSLPRVKKSKSFAVVKRLDNDFKPSPKDENTIKNRVKNSIRNSFLSKHIRTAGKFDSSNVKPNADASQQCEVDIGEKNKLNSDAFRGLSGSFQESIEAFTDFSNFEEKCKAHIDAFCPDGIEINRHLEDASSKACKEPETCLDICPSEANTSVEDDSVFNSLSASLAPSRRSSISADIPSSHIIFQAQNTNCKPFCLDACPCELQTELSTELPSRGLKSSVKQNSQRLENIKDCSADSTSSDQSHRKASSVSDASSRIQRKASSHSNTSEDQIKESASTTDPDAMSHHGQANYGTLRRGIKATTSRLIGSSMRRPGLSPAISLDRSGGSGLPDSARFVDGVSFKGKLIGVLEVEAARGDRMCQEALQELKGAVRAAGEHKQRIAITVAMDGIRLRDDRSGDCLYHHPVHKISFIAQDMTDARAFGYIFGSPESGHKFFGIKTEKAASQVVIAMRDLFQVVFELKKKEIEKARSQLEEGRDGADFKDTGLLGLDGGFISASLTCGAGGAIADLLDLQSELSNLQRGLSQISSRHQASAAVVAPSSHLQKEGTPHDPFGDSFVPSSSGGKAGLPVSGSSTLPSAKSRMSSTSSSNSVPPALAPPPLSGRARHDSAQSRCSGQPPLQQQSGISSSDAEHLSFVKFPVDFNNMTRPGALSVPPHDLHEDRYAVFKDIRPASDESLNDFKSTTACGGSFSNSSRLAVSQEAMDTSRLRDFREEWDLNDLTANNTGEGVGQPDDKRGSNYDVFTELDPLGTGKVRPFVDKKDFFNDVKVKPKRLRELGDGEDSHPGSPRARPVGVIPTELSMLVASTSTYSSSGHLYTSNEGLNSMHNVPSSATATTPMHTSVIASHSFNDNFGSLHNSFDNYRSHQPLGSDQQFEPQSSGFADFNRFSGESPRSQRSEVSASSMADEPAAQHLTVALPPESFRDSPPSYSPPEQNIGESPQKTVTKTLLKQVVHTGGASPKTLPRSHKFCKQTSVEGDWDAPSQQQDRYDLAEEEGSLSGVYDNSSTNTCPVTSEAAGGLSPRPRPRSNLTKHLSASSATLPMRQSHYRFERKYSHDQNIEHLYDQKYTSVEKFDDIKYGDDEFSPDMECRPFPNDDLETGFDQAPVPPPRPAPLEPPPLPPKRQPTHVTLRPPPRPPTSSADTHYFYISDKYETPPGEEADNPSSPPIPLPMRKTRYSEMTQPSSIPDRSTKPVLNNTELPFHFPRPNISPTNEASGLASVPPLSLGSRDSTPSKTSTPSGKSPRSSSKPLTGSIDLTNTSLDQLAAKLEIPVEQLAKMTVVELAACLAQLQLKQDSSDSQPSFDRSSCTSHIRGNDIHAPPPSYRDNSLERSSLGRSFMKFADCEEFARFDAQFPVSPVNGSDVTRSLESRIIQKGLGAPVSEDRYAVFRELNSTAKHKSVFDENFLTPQNSMEDEGSEMSSTTFKVNFEGHDFRQDSMDQKSSFSDDLDHERDHKQWSSSALREADGLAAFRSPDVSEYENFEPHFETKFDDDFGSTDKHSLDMVDMSALRSPASQKRSTDSGKSPFTDDFSCVSQEEIARTLHVTKSSSESLGKFDDDFVPPVQASLEDRYAVFRELALNETPARNASTSSKSLFDDNFVENCKDTNVLDSGFLSTAEDKFDDVFQEHEEGREDLDVKTRARCASEFTHQNCEDNDSFNKSPFDDDFTNRSDRYEVLKEVESEREPSLEGEYGTLEETGSESFRNSPCETSRNTRNKGSVKECQNNNDKYELNQFQGHSEDTFESRDSPYEDCHATAGVGDNGSYQSSRHNVLESPAQESQDYSQENDSVECRFRISNDLGRAADHHGRSNSQQGTRCSVGSDGSSGAFRYSHQSPFEDNFSAVTAGSVTDDLQFDTAFPSLHPMPDSFPENESSRNDPFGTEPPEEMFIIDNNSFANFDQAFHHETEPTFTSVDVLNHTPCTPNPSFDVSDDSVFPDDRVEFRVSARFAANAQSPIADDDPDNIFRRNSDPFADDFFSDGTEQGESIEREFRTAQCNEANEWKESFCSTFDFERDGRN